MFVKWILLTVMFWLWIYLAVGWIMCRDEPIAWKRVVYFLFWGILPYLMAQSERLAKWLNEKFGSETIWVDGSHAKSA